MVLESANKDFVTWHELALTSLLSARHYQHFDFCLHQDRYITNLQIVHQLHMYRSIVSQIQHITYSILHVV